MTPAYPALVLNADFSPLSTYPLSQWDFARTMRNVLKERVIVLETYDTMLRSSRITYQPPSVVALKTYISAGRSVPLTRMNLFLRDDFTCQYCGRKFGSDELTFDHVIPRAKGGRSTWDNLSAACVSCNSRKGDRQSMQPLRQPRKPEPREMARKRKLRPDNLHKTWHDYLYWSGVLETD